MATSHPNCDLQQVQAVECGMEVEASGSQHTINCTSPFLENLSQHFNSDGFSDVTLVVGNKHYPVLRSILAVSSPYFQSMFYGGDWRERTGREIKLEETEACQDVFPTFLKYFYSGSVTVSRDSVVPLVTLADKYGVDILKEQCTILMTKLLNQGDIEGALTWLSFAEQTRIEHLAQRCFDIICFNFEKASTFPTWSFLSLSQMKTILQRPDLVAPSEYTVYLAVEKWLLANALNGSDEVLKGVQFKNMTTEELLQVEESKLASASSPTTCDLIKTHTMEAFRHMCITKEGKVAKDSQGPLKRVYTSKVRTQAATFSNDALILQPTCNSLHDSHSKLKWQLKRINAGNYKIILQSVLSVFSQRASRSVFEPSPAMVFAFPHAQQYPGYNDQNLLGSTVHVRVLILFRHSDGVIHQLINYAGDATIPEKSGDTLVALPAPSDRDYNPHDILYSFEILT